MALPCQRSGCQRLAAAGLQAISPNPSGTLATPAETEVSSGSMLCVCSQGLQNHAYKTWLEEQACDSTPRSFELEVEVQRKCDRPD